MREKPVTAVPTGICPLLDFTRRGQKFFKNFLQGSFLSIQGGDIYGY